jgi:hypothetical protein
VLVMSVVAGTADFFMIRSWSNRRSVALFTPPPPARRRAG